NNLDLAQSSTKRTHTESRKQKGGENKEDSIKDNNLNLAQSSTKRTHIESTISKTIYGMLEKRLAEMLIVSGLIRFSESYDTNITIVIAEFDVIVYPKRTKAFKWIADLDKVTLSDLKESIFSMRKPQKIDKDSMELTIISNGEKYIPRNDIEFQLLLDYSCQRSDLYQLSDDDDPSLSVFPLLECGITELNDEGSKMMINHLVTDLTLRYKYFRTNNEASRSHFVSAFLLAVTNCFDDKLTVCAEKQITGKNGHGPVDFAL
ncbi:3267_t:CDS:2, partial [Racocetra persica]